MHNPNALWLLALKQQLKDLKTQKTQYPYIEHTWVYSSSNVFYIRDYHTNTLLYDHSQSLTVDWVNQGYLKSFVLPLSSLFKKDEFETHPYLIFNHENSLVLVAQFDGYWLCLIPCIEKPTREVNKPHHIDPREFYGYNSSQIEPHLICFSVLEIESSRIEQQLLHSVNWLDQLQDINNLLRAKEKFQPYGEQPLPLVSNLYQYHYSEPQPLVSQTTEKVNLAFSLYEDLSRNIINLNGYMHPRNESSDWQYLNYDERENISAYLSELVKKQNQLFCKMANHYEQAYFDINELKPTLKELKIPYTIEKIESSATDNMGESILEQAEPQEPLITNWSEFLKSLLFLILFLAIVMCLLYGIFWLSQRFAFINWLLIFIAAISFLMIVARK